MEKDKGGWQCQVFLHKGYVIKKPRNYKGVRKRAYNWLKENQKKSEEEISEIARECFNDIKKGKRIIERSGIPKEYLGNPIFYKDGRVKQKRVVELRARIHNLVRKGKIKEAERVIDKYFDFIKLLWSYGIHEKPYKISQNFGIFKDKIILLDLFEITDNYKSVKNSFGRGINVEDKFLSWSITKKMISYYRKVAKKTLNVKTLNVYWKKFN